MKKNPNKLKRISRIYSQLVFVFLLIGFMSGCPSTGGISSINHLREAQVAFNESAGLENKIRLSGLNPFEASDMKGAVGNTVTIKNGYASALISINKIYPSQKEQLAEDNILGHVLFLKAVSQWRTGSFENALNTAKEAKKEAGDQLYPRDSAILTALSGLIKIDLAYKHIQKFTRIKEYIEDKEKLKKYLMDNSLIPEKEISTEMLNDVTILNKHFLQRIRGRLVTHQNNEDAVSDLNAARKKVDSEHEVNLYLIQAQLTAYRNYQVACQHILSHGPGTDDKALIQAREHLNELKKLCDYLKSPESTNLIAYWRDLCRI